MQATVVSFPGRTRRVELPGLRAQLREVLAAAEVQFRDGETADLAVNGETTTDLSVPVEDGATVTKTKRVEGGL